VDLLVKREKNNLPLIFFVIPKISINKNFHLQHKYYVDQLDKSTKQVLFYFYFYFSNTRYSNQYDGSRH
jgi:hypothetical protein